MPLMRTPEGVVVQVPDDQELGARSVGYTPVAPAEAAAALTRLDRGENTLAGGATAVATGALSGATLGLSDAAIAALGTQGTVRDVAAARAAHPYLSAGATIAGAVLPAVLSGGESLAAAPARLVSEGGQAIARAGAEAGLGRIGGAALGGAAEGAVYGVGQGVSELALSSDPLTMERAASVLSSNALYGAAGGAAAGGLGHAAELGLARAKGAIDGALLRQSEGRAMKAVGELEAQAAAEPGAVTAATDVGTLDSKGLSEAERQEVARIDTERQPVRERFVEDLEAAHKAREPDKEWLSIVADRHPDKYTREQAKVVFNVDRKVRNLLDNRVGLAERPTRALEWLQQERQSLDALAERGRADLDSFRESALAAPDVVRKELLAGELPGFVVGKGGISPSSPVIDDIIAREVQARFPRDTNGGLVLPKLLEGFEDNRIGVALSKNADLQQLVANLSRAPRSERLSQIEAAREALRTRTSAPTPTAQPSLGRELLNVAAPFAGPLGAVAAHGSKAIESLRKVAAAAGERAGRAASSFLDVAGKATKKASPYAPVVATKVLAAIRYGQRDDDEPRVHPVAAAGKPDGLPALYRARTDEIKGQVHIAADGSFQMRPDARAKLAAKFDGIRHVDPHAADQFETAGARRIEYLASIIPRRPDIGGVQIGPDRWQPSDMVMRSFARSANAVEHPFDVLDRAAHGRVVPEEAAALRAVHPEILASFTGGVAQQLPSLRRNLPYVRRLALSILTGMPVDAAMTPAVLRTIQGMYRAEPGTAGGTQAPIAQAKFGSVKRVDPGTPAQRREGLLAP